jgi:hypothetical protein
MCDMSRCKIARLFVAHEKVLWPINNHKRAVQNTSLMLVSANPHCGDTARA